MPAFPFPPFESLPLPLPAWALGGTLLGAIVGSHVATLLLRWPKGESASRGRSHCDACGRTLRARDLVPLLSYLARRGACAACGARIDPLHPLVELAAAAIGGLSLALLPGGSGLAGALLGWLLLLIGLLDLRHFWLPDRTTLALALAAIGCAALGLPPAPLDRLIGGIAGFAALAAIGWAYRRFRGREGLGGGDPKLLGALGLWLGWQALPLLLLLASLTGLAGALAARAAGRRVGASDAVPLGALMALAAWPLWLWLSRTGWALP